MSRTTLISLTFALACACASPAASTAPASSAPTAHKDTPAEHSARIATPLEKIDHFYVMVTDPQATMGCFTDILGLPVAWPVDPFSDGAFTATTGGAFAGNLNIELVAPFLGDLRFSGIAFKPGASVEQVLDQLERDGIEPIAPKHEFVIQNVNQESQSQFWRRVRTYMSAGGGPAWTTAGLMDIGRVPHDGTGPDGGTHLFLCEYHMGMDAINEQNRSELEKRNEQNRIKPGDGSPGILGVAAITVQVAADEDAARKALSALVGDDFAERTGIEIKVVGGDRDRFLGFTLRVASVERAVAHLSARGIAVNDNEAGQTFQCPGMPDVSIALQQN